MNAIEIRKIVLSQLRNNFALTKDEQEIILTSPMDYYERTLECLGASKNKYYRNMGEGLNPFHSNSCCVYLYWMSNFFSVQGYKDIADKIYYLNKLLNCVELYHEVAMPHIWLCEHPLGTVIGRGKLGSKFFFMQRCSIGQNHGVYPTLGNNVTMCFNSIVIGNSHIGNNVVISASTYIKDQDVPDNVVVFGSSPNLVFKPNTLENTIWK